MAAELRRRFNVRWIGLSGLAENDSPETQPSVPRGLVFKVAAPHQLQERKCL